MALGLIHSLHQTITNAPIRSYVFFVCVSALTLVTVLLRRNRGLSVFIINLSRQSFTQRFKSVKLISSQTIKR